MQQEQLLDKIRKSIYQVHKDIPCSETNYQRFYVHPFLEQLFGQITDKGDNFSVMDARKMTLEKVIRNYAGFPRMLCGFTDIVLQTGNGALEGVRGLVEIKRAFDTLYQSVWDLPRKQVIAQLTMFRSEINSDLFLKACVTDLFGCCAIVHPPITDGHHAEYFISQRCSSSREIILLLLLMGSDLTSAQWDILMKNDDRCIVCVDDTDRVEAAAHKDPDVDDIEGAVASRTRSSYQNSKISNDNIVAQKANSKATVANKENLELCTSIHHADEIGENMLRSDCVHLKSAVIVRLTAENLAMYAK